MDSAAPIATGHCRHETHGRCTHYFWEVMNRCGKPGLAPYLCTIWKFKMQAMRAHHEALVRARNFNLDDSARARELARRAVPAPEGRAGCPNFHSRDGSLECRYFFLETCLLLFPKCPGTCDEYLPRIDQTGGGPALTY